MPFVPTGAHAGFQQAYVRLDRMKANTATGGLVCAKPNTVGTEAKVLVTFPSTYTLNTTAANWTVSAGATEIPAGSTAWPTIATASSADNTTKVVTFAGGDLTVGTLYCFVFAAVNTLTTAAAAANSQQASVQTQTSGSAVVDSTQIALSNVTDDTITVTAVVPPSFIFALSGNADTFAGNLDPLNVVSTAGVVATVTTNAKGGWIAWAKDSQQGLYSANTGYTLSTVGTKTGTYANGTPDGVTSTLVAGTEGYVLDVDATLDATGGCTFGSPYGIAAEYDGNTAFKGGSLMGNYQQIASCSGTSPATANGDQITLVERAAISGATPASSDYSDIITVVGAGNF
jgi:hypothetical protein